MYRVVKRNKKLMIIDNNDKMIYTPPSFLKDKIASREQVQELCDEFNRLTSRDIDAIIRFESQLNNKVN
jgi:hypothetical protein